jgi:hypothetical protein
MKNDITAIRGIDREVLRKFRARTIEERMRMGDALTVAMKRWIAEERKRKVSPPHSIRVKPFDWGKGTEKTSAEVDEILYGRKR